MNKFKTGDQVRCITEHKEDRTFGVLGVIYTVKEYHNQGNMLLEGNGIRESAVMPYRFELVEEEPMTPNNPAIEEYTKTITVRKVRANTFPIAFDSHLKVAPYGDQVNLTFRTIGNGRLGYTAKLKTNELRTLAKQLAEIADVMDENLKD